MQMRKTYGKQAEKTVVGAVEDRVHNISEIETLFPLQS